VSRDNAVGIAIRYGLDGPGIKFRWEREFSHPSSQAVGLTQRVTSLFRRGGGGVKGPGRGVDHSLPSNVEVKERVGLYLYAPSGTSWSVLGEIYVL